MPPVAVLSPSAPLGVPLVTAYHPRAILAGRTERSVDGLARLGSVGAMGFSVTIPLVTLLAFASAQITGRHDFPEALLATALYLPLHVRHVRGALSGTRPRALPFTLLAMAAVLIGFTPLLGVIWLYSFHALAASLLISLRPRLSVPSVAVLLAGVGVWASHHLSRGYGSPLAVYLPAGVLDRAATVFVLVWLVRALRRIQSTRLALADEALQAERQRFDNELGRTVGAQLEDVVRRGNHAAETLRLSPREADAELESLVQTSRSALAEARRLIGRYKLVSPRAELEKAAALLRAAGLDVHLELADGASVSALDESIRRSLRAAVADLLSREATGPVVLRLERRDGADALEVVAVAVAERVA